MEGGGEGRSSDGLDVTRWLTLSHCGVTVTIIIIIINDACVSRGSEVMKGRGGSAGGGGTQVVLTADSSQLRSLSLSTLDNLHESCLQNIRYTRDYFSVPEF